MAEPDKQAMIYVAGSDSELRHMCFTLLEEGLVSHADMIDRAPFTLDEDGVADLRWSGKTIVLVCARKTIKKVFRRMKALYLGDDLTAYAVPVLTVM